MSPTGSTLKDRLAAVNYTWSQAGEDIAGGQTSIAKVLADWMNSPAHCGVLMTASFKEVGVACMPGTASTAYDPYWTMDFGVPR